MLQPKAARTASLGVAFAILGACGFAVKGIFAKLLYARGWDYVEVTTCRSLFSLPVIFGWAVWRTGAGSLFDAPLRPLLGAAVAGLLCYYAGTLLDFRALTLVDASVERVLLFTYPSLVVMLHALVYRRWPASRTYFSLACTYAGIFLVVSGFDLKILRANLLGAGLVLGCALTYAIYYLASDRVATRLGSVRYILIATLASAGALTLHFLAFHGWSPSRRWDPTDLLLFSGLVVISTVLPMVLTAEGVSRLGAPRAAIVSTVGPPITILLAAWLLGEALTAPQWIGVALIGLGIAILEIVRIGTNSSIR